MRLDRASEEHVRELLDDTELPRDQLPYTEEFDRLKEAFYDRTFKKLSDSEFWQILARIGKQGGVRGKKTRDSAPGLSEEQKELLLRKLPVPIGQTDGLPYTDKMTKLVAGFNGATGLDLSDRDVWLGVLALRK